MFQARKAVPVDDHEFENTENHEPGTNLAAERAGYSTPPFKHLQPVQQMAQTVPPFSPEANHDPPALKSLGQT